MSRVGHNGFTTRTTRNHELKENLKGRIGIVISHRFSTMRIADRIAVIDDGKVTELGTHEQLLAAGNRYGKLFELQASGYR